MTEEYVLDPGSWPAMPAAHRAFLGRALAKLRADARLAGVAAGGSFVTGDLDEHSDLDLVVVSLPGASDEVLREGPALARDLGPLLAAFPGDHVGETRLLICLYGPPLLHVDLKFVSTDELVHRVEDPAILWDRDGALRSALSRATATYPEPQPQWIEDRFWVWVHYIAGKIARGELFEAIDALGFVRARVLGPMALLQAGVRPNGVRRIELSVPARVPSLQSTVACHDHRSCRTALIATVELYAELRERLASPSLVRRSEAEDAARSLLGAHAGDTVSCSFCRKSMDEVRKIVAGPSVYICDECIDLCNDIIAEECDREEPAVEAAARDQLSVVSACIVCRLPRIATEVLLVPGAGFVCHPCADAVRAVADARLPPPSEATDACRLCGLDLPTVTIPGRGALCEACVEAVNAISARPDRT